MKRFIYGLLFSWIDLFDAIICFLTLGTYNPCLAMQFAAWYALWNIKRRVKQAPEAK